MMQIPEWLLNLIIGGTIGFVFKVIFGLIRKNEIKSDLADEKLSQEIKEMRELYRNNDRELYQAQGEMKAQAAYERGLREGKDSVN